MLVRFGPATFISSWIAAAGCSDPIAISDAADRDTAFPPRVDAARDAGPVPDTSRPPPAIDLVADLADPFAPARLRRGFPFLVSSREPEPPDGLLNRDHSFYLSEENGWGVMIERPGPGVITRWWMTIGGLPGERDPEAIRVRFWVDGSEIDPDGGEPGTTLEFLTNGSVVGLASPFTLGREGTSGGFVVSQPIHYQRAFRADVQLNPGWTYYQFEGYDYEPGTAVVPFTYPPRLEELAKLEAAAMLWRDHEHPGAVREGDPVDLAPSTSTELRWLGPAVATELRVEVARAHRDDVSLHLLVDGDAVADAPLSWLVGATEPAASSYDSALAVVDPDIVRLFYPVPFESELVMSLRNDSTRGVVRARIAVRTVNGPLDRDLGRLRVQCGVRGPVPSISMCGTAEPSLRIPNNVVASWTGARGHYVGHSLVQRVSSSWWCALEPDHEVWIDGSYALLGTGMEDYYSAGFYFMNGPVAWLLAGATGWTRSALDGSAATHVYRHHLVDTIPFENEFRFEFESYVEETTFTGCSFFYVAPER